MRKEVSKYAKSKSLHVRQEELHVLGELMTEIVDNVVVKEDQWYYMTTTMQVNERIGAILSTGENVVTFLGYGVYVGDSIPDDAVGGMAEMARELGTKNPRLEMDDGSVVYGCECWWGPEEEMKAYILQSERAGFTIVHRRIDDIRREYLCKKS